MPRPPAAVAAANDSRSDGPNIGKTSTVYGGNNKEEEEDEDEDEDNDKDDGQLQQMVNNVAVVLTTKRVGDTHLSSEESARPAKRQRPLPYGDSSPELRHDEAGSYNDSYGDDELNNTKAELDGNDERPRPAERKRPSSSYDGPNQRKRKHHFQQRSPPPALYHAPSPISTIQSHIPSLIRVQESPWALVPRVDCLRRRHLHYKAWIQRYHLTAATLADLLETSYRYWLRLPSVRTPYITAPLQR
ncbi:MAG: hypothetical protein M1839_005208 [Geoglossum umbratile]|nr:MAG: hypothetical protein M1839_005208 [Geoglossum umbratile]